MTTTHYAAIDHSDPTGAVYGIGTSPNEAQVQADEGAGQYQSEPGHYAIVPCSPAAARYVKEHGGAPSEHLSVSLRAGVCLRSEEE